MAATHHDDFKGQLSRSSDEEVAIPAGSLEPLSDAATKRLLRKIDFKVSSCSVVGLASEGEGWAREDGCCLLWEGCLTLQARRAER